MPSAFDEFTERASAGYKGGTTAETRNRDTLRHAMERGGFTVNDSEWWHFDHDDWERYPVTDEPMG